MRAKRLGGCPRKGRESGRKAVVLVAHSPRRHHHGPCRALLSEKVRGAFLVAPSNVERDNLTAGIDRAFAPVPRDPLPFPSLLVASRNDPFCTYEKADEFAASWGSLLVDAGEAGHINVDAGFGPWPEGLMRFAGFLGRL